MSDHFMSWSADGPDFDGDGFDGDGGPDGVDSSPGGFDDPLGGPDDGYPVEGFGPADDADPDGGSVGFGGGDVPEGPDGGDHADGDTGELGYGTGGDGVDVPDDVDDGPGSDGFDGPPEPDGPAYEGFGGAEVPVGADPDAGAYVDGWPEPQFPEPVDLDVPEPVDGFPWADPAVLGADGPVTAEPAGEPLGAPEPADLAGYAGESAPDGVDGWRALAGSEDPATSALARFWAPDGPAAGVG